MMRTCCEEEGEGGDKVLVFVLEDRDIRGTDGGVSISSPAEYKAMVYP